MAFLFRDRHPVIARFFDGVNFLSSPLVFVGPVINGLVAFTPDVFADACNPPTQPSTLQDTGKMLAYGLWAGLLALRIAYSLVKRCVSKQRLLHWNKRAEGFEHGFNEVMDALECLAFRVALLRHVGVSLWASALVSIRFVWPLYCLAFGVKRGAHQHLKNNDHHTMVSVGEALYNGESLSSALITLAQLFYTVIVSPYFNINEPKYRTQQLVLLGAMWAIGEVLGWAGVMRVHAWRGVRFVEGGVNMLFYTFSIFTSQIACSFPKEMNGDGFTYKGAWICLAALVVSMPFALACADSTQEYLFKHHHKEKSQSYNALDGDDEKKHKDKASSKNTATGLNCC